MTEQLSSIVFASTILFLTVLEKRRVNSIYTPFTLTAWPFVIIIILVNFFLYIMGFPIVSNRAIYFILLNLIIVWLIGFVFYYIVTHPKNKIVDFKEVFKPFIPYKNALILISWVVFFITFFRVQSLVNSHGGWWYIGTHEFEKQIIVGFTAHVIMLGKVCLILLYLISLKSKKKLLIYLTLFALVLSIFITQVKYHLILLIFMIFLINNLQKDVNIQIRKIIKVSLFLIMIFLVYNFILSIGWQSLTLADEELWEFFIYQFFNYFVSGPIMLDKWMNWSFIKPDWTMFIVFINTWNVIIGDPIRINAVPYVSYGFLPTAPGYLSNVGTNFGVYYMIGGIQFTLFMTILISAISYFLYYKTKYSGSPILIYFNLLFLTLGMLSFFVQFFTLLSIYETSVFFVLFIIIFRGLNRFKLLIKN